MSADICLSAAEMVTDLELGLHVSQVDAAKMIRDLAAEIVRLRGEVAFAASVIGRYAVESAIRDEGADTPALSEANGDPKCPDCGFGVLYECPACSSTNYPRDALATHPSACELGAVRDGAR